MRSCLAFRFLRWLARRRMSLILNLLKTCQNFCFSNWSLIKAMSKNSKPVDVLLHLNPCIQYCRLHNCWACQASHRDLYSIHFRCDWIHLSPHILLLPQSEIHHRSITLNYASYSQVSLRLFIQTFLECSRDSSFSLGWI